MGLNTHNARVEFGRHRGNLVTRIPVSYLTWAISNRIDYKCALADGLKVPFCEAAMAELDRRGIRIADMDISLHAIDRISQRYIKTWEDTRQEGEGIASWAQRVARDAFQSEKTEGATQVTIQHLGIKWVFQADLLVPTVLTVK